MVENNYLSSTDKSRQTELSHKQNLTPQEQHDLDILNRKDAETSKALVGACMGGDADACKAARTDAQEKQASYKNLGYQNTKESQAGYQQIQQLLDGTSAEAKQTQELFNGMVAAYVRTGMSEDAAKSAVGYQLGAVYVVGGIAGIGSGKAADEGLTPGVKPSVPSAEAAAANAGKGTAGSLSGQPTKLPPNASAENIRSLQRENEGAAILSQNGYHVEQNPATLGVKNPDYKINGEVFDNIAPKTNSVRNIYDRALEKVNSGQTKNVVINLSDTKASVSDLQKQFSDWPMKGLDKVIVIDQSGKPIKIK